jgi:hypothetical protein
LIAAVSLLAIKRKTHSLVTASSDDGTSHVQEKVPAWDTSTPATLESAPLSHAIFGEWLQVLTSYLVGEYVVIEIGNPKIHVRDSCSGRIGLEPTLQIRIPANRYGKANGNRLEKIWHAGEEPVVLYNLGLNK